MTVSAVIVAYRTGPVLFACLDSALGAPGIDEVILVDNGNPKDVEHALDMMASDRENLTLLRGQGNIGFAASCNLGARAAQGAHLLFLNPDALVTRAAVPRLMEAARYAPRPWIAGARILGLNGKEQRGGRRDELTMWRAFVEVSGLSRLEPLSRVFRSMHRERDPVPDEAMEVGAVSGAAMLIRADDFAALDGFDEGYFVHVEDLDLCRRVHEAGGAVMFAPDAVVIHEGATSDVDALVVARMKGRGLARYFRIHARGVAGKIAAAVLTPAVEAAAAFGGLLRRSNGKK